MAVFFFLLAIIGGALVGDLLWENTTTGEVTVLSRTLVDYPQGWLLAAAAALGFVVALLLVASVNSTTARRSRRRQLRAMRHDLEAHGIEPEREYTGWLDESLDRRESGSHADEPRERQSEPLYEQSRRAIRQHDDGRQH